MEFWLLPYLFLYIYLLTAGGYTDERMCRYIEKPGGESYPMVPCCPCVSVRRNQGRLTKPLNEGTHLFLRQNAVESLYKVAHRSLAVASYHIIDSLDMTDVVSLAGSPNMGLI